MKQDEIGVIKALIELTTATVNLAIGIVGYKAIKANKKKRKK